MTNWTEVLAAKGVDVGHITDTVKAAEAKLQAYQEQLHKDIKVKHESENHGLTQHQVQVIVKEHLSPAQYEFCGADFAAEVWDQL